MPAIGAANRDPDAFPEPNRLDLSRRPNRHVSFGFGVHLCVGAPLARLQAQVVLPKLVRRLPNLELTSEKLEWDRNLLHRGLKALPVSW